jgi:hypothetical protein
MSTYGRTSLGTIGGSIQLTADGKPEMKSGGVTLDWSTIAAVAGADVTWDDGVTVAIGEKAVRYGQLLCRITASGLFGPYDPAAADGRQLLVSGDCFWANESVKQNDLHSDHPPALFGGKVFANRLIQSGVAAHTLALGPTLAEVLATFPRLHLVKD